MRFRTTALLAAVAALVPALTGLAAPAQATTVSPGCAPLSSGQVDPNGQPTAVAAIAPQGHLVTGYCVQAETGAATYVELAAPTTWFVVRHPSGKPVAHYSYAWAVTDAAGVVQPDQDPSSPEVDEAPEVDSTPAPALSPWSWDWTYADPTCDALTVRYPANLPAGQANDVNIRFDSNLGRDTFNFHHNEGTWSGTTSFTYAQHAKYPTSGLRWFTVEWIQVAGTNHHWQGALTCLVSSDGKASTVDVPQAVTTISGFNTSTVQVVRGRAAATDAVVCDETDHGTVLLQRLVGGVWRTVKAVTSTDGAARVSFPKETRVGTYAYRLASPDTAFATGTVTRALTVKVVKPRR